MKIIVWGINYAPEVTGIAPYNTSLCEFLGARGHHVHMVTSFSYYPEWRKRKEDCGKWFGNELSNGVRICRCWHYVPRKPSTLRRILHELSFVVTSLLTVLTLPKPDAYVVISPPLLLGFAAWVVGLVKRTPFVFHVQDLQPDAASSMGMVKTGPLLRVLYALESLAYNKAARVSGISRGMLRAFAQKGVPPSKLILFPNGTTLPDFSQLPHPGEFRKRLALGSSELLAVYSGNLGVKHGVEILLDAAKLILTNRIRIVICGDGARREALELKAVEMGLSNVIFLPLQPEKQYLEMMVDADVYLVTQQPGSGSLFFPSKLLKGLALGKAMVVVADEESELTIASRDGRFALVVPPLSPEQLVLALDRLRINPEQRLFLGVAGRSYAQQFELSRILASFERDLDHLVGRMAPSPSPVASLSTPQQDTPFESVR